jgi:hypothetical protein
MRLIKWLCILTSLASFFPVYAEYDYQTQIISRSFPVALVWRNNFGYGKKLWKVNDVLYGYVRANTNLDTSAVVNTAGGSIDLFPISFFGFTVGASTTKRDIELRQFDCESITCKGWVRRKHVGLKFALAKDRFFLMGQAERVDQRLSRHSGMNFADEQTSLIANSDGDIMKRINLTLGYRLNETYSLLGHYVNQNMKQFRNNAQMRLLFIEKKRGDWSYMWGNGIFKTPFDQSVFTTLFVITWNGKKGVRLF